MVPDNLEAFFTATAGASGALVGLLFVAVSVSRDDILGASASVANKVRASLALTCLITPLVLSLFALVPGIGVRTPLIIAGAVGLLFAAGSMRRMITGRHTDRRQLTILIGYILVMIADIGLGIYLQSNPSSDTAISIVCALLVVLLGLGIDRAWELVGGRRSTVSNSITDLIHGEPRPNGEAPIRDRDEGA